MTGEENTTPLSDVTEVENTPEEPSVIDKLIDEINENKFRINTLENRIEELERKTARM